MSEALWEELTRPFSAALERYGLDIAHAFRVDAFNRTATGRDVLPDFGRPNALAVLVGNTRALWEPLKAAVKDDGGLATSAHPLDEYVERHIARAIPDGAPRHAILHSHLMDPAPIPIQRIAESAGFAILAPSHLSVHKLFGPWFGLRGAVIFDMDGPLAYPPKLNCVCKPCARPCMRALATALEASGADAPNLDVNNEAWRPWLAVRDACPEGRRFRYEPEQIYYHYGKDLQHIRSDPPPSGRRG